MKDSPHNNSKFRKNSSYLYKLEKVYLFSQDHDGIRQEIRKNSNLKAISWSTSDHEVDYFFESTEDQLLLTHKKETYYFNVKPYSGIYLENLIHVVVAASELGLSISEIQLGINHLKPVAMRLELKRGKNNVYILDDTYNNDISGLKIALDYVEQQRQKKRTTLIISDFLQSGQDHIRVYEDVRSTIMRSNVDRLITIGEEIGRFLIMEGVDVLHYQSTDHFLKDKPYFGDEMVLVKGARTFHFEKIVSAFRRKKSRDYSGGQL